MIALFSSRGVAVTLLLAAVGAHVAHAAAPDLSCTGSLATTGGPNATIQCSGALTLTGGSLSFDDSLTLVAATSLDLVNVTLTSHDISLTAPTAITLDALSQLNSMGKPAGSITLTSTYIQLDGTIVTSDGKVASNGHLGTTPDTGSGSIAWSSGTSVGGYNDTFYHARSLEVRHPIGLNAHVIGGPLTVIDGSVTLMPSVPEPSALILMSLGLMMIGAGATIRRT